MARDERERLYNRASIREEVSPALTCTEGVGRAPAGGSSENGAESFPSASACSRSRAYAFLTSLWKVDTVLIPLVLGWQVRVWLTFEIYAPATF